MTWNDRSHDRNRWPPDEAKENTFCETEMKSRSFYLNGLPGMHSNFLL